MQYISHEILYNIIILWLQKVDVHPKNFLRFFPWRASPPRVTGSSCFIRNASRFPCNWNGTSVSSVSSSKSVAIGSLYSTSASIFLSLVPGDALWAAYGGKSRECFQRRLTLLSAPPSPRVPRIFHSPLIHEPRELNTCALNCRPSASFGSLWIVGPARSIRCIDPLSPLLSRRRIVFRARGQRGQQARGIFFGWKPVSGVVDSKAFEIFNSRLWFSCENLQWKFSARNFKRKI